MKILMIIALLISSLGVCMGQEDTVSAFPRDYMRDALVLNGQWERLLEHKEARIWEEQAAAKYEWDKTKVPGSLLNGLKREQREAVGFVWARRSFNLTREQARRDAVLRWGNVRHGAQVWINGTRIGAHPTIGPASFLIPRKLMKTAENQIVMKVPGWAGVIKNKAGKPLIPVGGGTQFWGIKDAVIHDDIWIDFYDRASLKWALAMPDLVKKEVGFKCRIWGNEIKPGLQLAITVKPADGSAGGGSLSAAVKEPGSFVVTVPLADIKPWSPESPFLYIADCTLTDGDGVCDTMQFRFGMKQLKIDKGYYELNGKKIYFRGSNLVHEWLRGNEFKKREDIKRYIVDEPAQVGINAFRTHTLPPNTSWANLGDEEGVMYFAELPLLYNYGDFKFTEDDYRIWHHHNLIDSEGWLTKLWNHPSIMMWVSSNESKGDTDWEAGPYREHLKNLDPTRPVFRSGGESELDEILDIHTCANNAWYAENHENFRVIEFSAQRNGRPINASEYNNWLDGPQQVKTRLYGTPDHPYAPYCQAEFDNEHAGLLRKYKFDMMLPYQWFNWSPMRREMHNQKPWRDDFDNPMLASLYSTMSPVFSNIDLLDRNYIAGSKQEITLNLINDLPEDFSTRVDAYLTPINPLYIESPEAGKAAIWHKRWDDVQFPADSVKDLPFELTVPKEEGVYYLLVVTNLQSAKPNVVSQRVIRSIDPQRSQHKLDMDELILLGATADARLWLRTQAINFREGLPDPIPLRSRIVIWEWRELDDRDAVTPALFGYAASGGKIIILDQVKAENKGESRTAKTWDWKELLDVQLKWDHSSRLHTYPETENPFLHNLQPEFLWRFNGLKGIAGNFFIKGPWPETMTRYFWIEKPEWPVLADFRAGNGIIRYSLVHFKERLLEDSPTYDPAAERLLLNVLFK